MVGTRAICFDAMAGAGALAAHRDLIVYFRPQQTLTEDCVLSVR